jgi:hypothetical protein
MELHQTNNASGQRIKNKDLKKRKTPQKPTTQLIVVQMNKTDRSQNTKCNDQ